METLWFCLVAIMIAMYAVFDGFDLGVGILHLHVAKTDSERVRVLRSIGPVWDGNEVWLLAAGGTLYFAFPLLYASSFSGFYLPLMMVLWLLMLRGIAIEFRSHVESAIWKAFWDAVFCGASALLAVFFGAALGNVIRGVPLNASGYFFEPLWTDFRLGKETGILDWYTVLVGLTSALTLTAHGAHWIVLKTDGEVRQRSREAAAKVWYGLTAMTLIITAVTFRVQPNVAERLRWQPWGCVFALLAVGGLFGMRWFARKEGEVKAFLSSCAYIVGMLTSAVFGVYPYVLPSNSDPNLGITLYTASAPLYGLKVGLAWWIPGMLLVTAYFAFTYRHFAGKVRLDEEGYGSTPSVP
jgi:cytochrome d ubiquinol oxidase subunit II